MWRKALSLGSKRGAPRTCLFLGVPGPRLYGMQRANSTRPRVRLERLATRQRFLHIWAAVIERRRLLWPERTSRLWGGSALHADSSTSSTRIHVLFFSAADAADIDMSHAWGKLVLQVLHCCSIRFLSISALVVVCCWCCCCVKEEEYARNRYVCHSHSLGCRFIISLICLCSTLCSFLCFVMFSHREHGTRLEALRYDVSNSACVCVCCEREVATEHQWLFTFTCSLLFIRD